MPRKIPKTLTDAPSQSLWRDGRRFMATALRVRYSKKKTRHTSGGPATHKGSKCQKCRRRLGLLWSLDLADPVIPDFVREGFAPAGRLPFYVCWQCMAASYAVQSDAQIRCFPFDSYDNTVEEDESPFDEDIPQESPLQAIELERIPTTIDALLCLSDEIEIADLDGSALRALGQYLGGNVNSGWDLVLSQVGGRPMIYQRRRDLVCPNGKCPAHKLEAPYGQSQRRYLMKDLAVVHETEDPHLNQICFQMVYYICRVCFSIRAEYRCA